jgi:hypothetical protein
MLAGSIGDCSLNCARKRIEKKEIFAKKAHR